VFTNDSWIEQISVILESISFVRKLLEKLNSRSLIFFLNEIQSFSIFIYLIETYSRSKYEVKRLEHLKMFSRQSRKYNITTRAEERQLLAFKCWRHLHPICGSNLQKTFNWFTERNGFVWKAENISEAVGGHQWQLCLLKMRWKENTSSIETKKGACDAWRVGITSTDAVIPCCDRKKSCKQKINLCYIKSCIVIYNHWSHWCRYKPTKKQT